MGKPENPRGPSEKRRADVPKVFISSTVEDLRSFREKAKEAAIRAGFLPVMQEYFPSSGNPPLGECMRKVAPCDVLLVIVARRYGWKPADQPPAQIRKSITWLECEEAKRNGQEVLALVVDDKAAWPVEYTEDYRLTEASQAGKRPQEIGEIVLDINESKAGLRSFRQWLDAGVTRCAFSTAEDFSIKVLQTLQEWKSRHHGEPVVREPSAAVFPPAYREWLIANYQHLDVEKLCGKEMVAPSLPEIFVPLYTRVGKNRRQMENEAESPSAREESEPVELEKLLVEQRMLVVEGHPGSGKTTLMKHVAYCLAQAENPCAALKPLAGHLPLLLLLKDANAFFREMEKNGETCRSAWEIVAWVCANRTAGTLAEETVRAFAAQGRLVLLLDGLDELAAPFRDALVNHFADLLITHPDIHLVFTGRPHGLQAARLQARRVKIEALGEEQVADFVGKWFGYFYSGATGPGGRSADSLVAEMRAHPAVGELTDNPLMLTAVCILYHDQKELPGQRAELYKRFVDNMLYRRFGPECETVLGFLKTLAHGMHMRRRKSCDEHEALAALKEVYRQQERETAVEYEARVRGRFAAIESACGLLKLEAGGYEFWHLTFQEFLCADSICDNAADPRHAVDRYWDDPWLTEMVELYIGYLAMRNKGIAHAIVADALERENPRHWLKAAAALLDIPADRRDTQSVLPHARARLLALIGEENDLDRRELARAGELLGWLGDPRDLREFVAIEGGEYKLERLGRVSLAPFSVGRYPVTNGWYGEFVAAGGYRDPQYWSAAGRRWLEVEHIELPKYWHGRSLNCPNAPVVWVCFWEAEAFANWWTAVAADGWIYYLPTQREWQAAAAGKEGRIFPWGNEADYSRCNCGEGEAVIGGPSTVGIFRRGATPQGVHDLAGNVWEWNQDEEENGARVLRGGGWLDGGGDVRSASRDSGDPGSRYALIGFRLARGHLVQTGQNE